jgi:hypothetical protein
MLDLTTKLIGHIFNAEADFLLVHDQSPRGAVFELVRINIHTGQASLDPAKRCLPISTNVQAASLSAFASYFNAIPIIIDMIEKCLSIERAIPAISTAARTLLDGRCIYACMDDRELSFRACN